MSKWPNIFRLGKMKWPMLFYLTSIIFHGIIAIAALIFLGPMYYWAVLLGIGSILFMISDQLLILDYFVITGTKYMVRISSAFYWVGMLIMVLSTAF
jgi:predicted lysophospholipase L1 biosynthesis ABC-type transport system permease subunit